MPISLTTAPSPAAQDKFSRRKVAPSVRTTAQWDLIPAAIRERCFFSARVQDAKILNEMRGLIAAELRHAKDGAGAYENRESFISKIKSKLEARGYPTGGTSLTDITSRKRLALIHKMAIEDAQGYAQ